jgi:quinol-cytochrome oxidoreductase complex cytochrome b subunit
VAPSWVRAVQRVGGLVLLGLLGVLTITGVILFLRFRPSTDHLVAFVRGLHRAAAALLIFVAVIEAGVAIVARPPVRWSRVAAAVAAVPIVVAAWMTGAWLAWDQVAIWAVTVGEDLRGYPLLWDDQVRFVIRDGQVVSLPTMQRLLVAHGLLAVAIGAVVVVLVRGARDRRPDQPRAPEARADAI